MMTYTDIRWASQDRAALDAALAALDGDARVAAIAPVQSATLAGVVHHFALIRVTEEIEAPAAPVFVDDAGLGMAVTGVFAAGPDRSVSPLRWMDRLSREKQIALHMAGRENAQIGFLLFRLGAAQTVDPDDPETVAGVQAMQAAGLIDADDARALLF